MSTNDRRDLSSLPALLRDARFLRGLSLREAARQMDVSASTLSRMESTDNGFTPDFASLARVAKWLKLEICLMPGGLPTQHEDQP